MDRSPKESHLDLSLRRQNQKRSRLVGLAVLLSVILLVFVFVRASRGNSAKGPWNPSHPVPRKFGATARVEEVATARVEEVASTHGNVTKDTFDAIYDYHIWEPDSTADDNGGGSGPGSSMVYTRRTRALV